MRNYLLFSFQGPNLRERSLIREYDQRLGDLKRNRRKSVLQTHRVHPFPFRTRKLSCAVLTILCWRRHGKIGQGRHPLSLKVGVINAQGPPVPIPNTEVKLCSAENTLLATARENRSMPTSPEGKPSGEHNRVKRGCSSVGRAPALQAGGHGFESHHLHHKRRHEHTA